MSSPEIFGTRLRTNHHKKRQGAYFTISGDVYRALTKNKAIMVCITAVPGIHAADETLPKMETCHGRQRKQEEQRKRQKTKAGAVQEKR